MRSKDEGSSSENNKNYDSTTSYKPQPAEALPIAESMD